MAGNCSGKLKQLSCIFSRSCPCASIGINIISKSFPEAVPGRKANNYPFLFVMQSVVLPDDNALGLSAGNRPRSTIPKFMINNSHVLQATLHREFGQEFNQTAGYTSTGIGRLPGRPMIARELNSVPLWIRPMRKRVRPITRRAARPPAKPPTAWADAMIDILEL